MNREPIFVQGLALLTNPIDTYTIIFWNPIELNLIKKGKLGNSYFIIELTNQYFWLNPKDEINKKQFKKTDIVLNVKNRSGTIKESFIITQKEIQQFL